MNLRLSIRPAAVEDRDSIKRLQGSCRQAAVSARERVDFLIPSEHKSRRLIEDRCVLLARAANHLVGMVSLDLDELELVDVLVAPNRRLQGIGRRLITEAERLAVRFGVTRMGLHAGETSIPFFRACGYQPLPGGQLSCTVPAGPNVLYLWRSFPRRQSRYGARIGRVLDGIGISRNYGRDHRLMLQEECPELATIGHDIHGREQMLRPNAAHAWYALRNAAREDGVSLEVASAYRTVGYQASIIERKKMAGQDLGDILTVSAAPGFSEHHTGRAIDIATPGSPALETEFENTLAFEWLLDSAQQFGFRLSYPRNNRHRIAYEPWHWFFTG